jgi:hypothetical protein
LLGTLARAWDRLEDRAEVVAAHRYYAWQEKGSVPAFWLWSLGSILWLDDSGGVPRAPLQLRLRTAGTVAVHGEDAMGYLRPEFDAPNRRALLAALGVAGEPSTRDLVGRLRSLQKAGPPRVGLTTDANLVYHALAGRLKSHGSLPNDLNQRELRAAFAEGNGLILTSLGWRPPARTLRGPPIFNKWRAFAPQLPDTERLWKQLHVHSPSPADAIGVIRELARTKHPIAGDDVVVYLESLRLLNTHLKATPPVASPEIRDLGKLPLWTTSGWRRLRPVYAIDDPTLAERLGDTVPVWLPGGELAQFSELLAPLRIVLLPAADLAVVEADEAVQDPDSSELLSLAVSHLQEDLVRNDPAALAALTINSQRLSGFQVCIHPDLRVRVEGLVSQSTSEIHIPAKVDLARDVVFLVDSRALHQVDGGGRAIAGLFDTPDRRRIAQAWLAACIKAEEGRSAQQLELPQQRATEDEAHNAKEMAERLASLSRDIADRHAGRAQRYAAPTGSPSAIIAASSEMPVRVSPAPKSRELVDPTKLVVINPGGRSGVGPALRRSLDHGRTEKPPFRGLPLPDRHTPPPRGVTAAPQFTAVDKESVGMELARRVLASDADELVDLRTQRRVGADAIDELDRYFELKVYLGDEPDTIRLEESEFLRALSTPDFFLVIVSNVEKGSSQPRVRIIVDPVHQLRMTESSAVSFTGVRSVEHSIVYDLGPAVQAQEED